MRALAAALATLGLICGAAPAADDAPMRQVAFVCEHGNVKSLMAATYFNQQAAQRGLRWRAVSRGAAPDSTTVPNPIVAGLSTDGVDVSDFHPAKLDATDVARAALIVAIGADLPAGIQVEEQHIQRWNDVPPASTNYGAARASLQAHVAELLERLALR